MMQCSDRDTTVTLPAYLHQLIDNKADLGQPSVFDATDDSGRIVFCPVTLTTTVVHNPTPAVVEDCSVVEDCTADPAPSDPLSAAF